MKRWLWWSGITFGVLVVASVGIWLFLISYWAIAGRYGTKHWAETKAEYEAKGFSFDPSTYLPRPIPDAENFATTPIWRYLVEAKTQKGVERYRVALFDAQKSVKKWRVENKIPSADWRCRKVSVPPPAVLFDGTQDQLNELYVAATRPGCQFPVSYNQDNPITTELPHLGPCLDLGHALHAHAMIQLAQGNTELAQKDISLIHKLGQSNAQSFFLLSAMVGCALYQLSHEILWQGIENHSWTETQLEEFQKQLASIDMLQTASDNLRSELVLTALPTLTWMHRKPTQQRAVGLCDLTKCTIADIYINKCIPVLDSKTHRFYPEKTPDPGEFKMPKWRCWLNPMNMIIPLMLSTSDGFLIRSAQTQSYLDMAQIACGLERYWLVNKKYPATLAELEPKYLAKVPHDLCNGEPLRYRVEPDGNYTLYSVGFNGTDDGGRIVTKSVNPSVIDMKQGDWVWPRSKP